MGVEADIREEQIMDLVIKHVIDLYFNPLMYG